MVKLLKKFFAGDKVFAKVRGYPAWPAKVEKVSDPNSKNARYSVYFYGTGETAVCKVEELFTYVDNKSKFATKALRRKFFNEGLEQLEQELKNDTNNAATNETDLKAIDEAREAREKDLTTGTLSVPEPTNTDADTGSLVIDEGDKKKSVKRKSAPMTVNHPDTPEMKKKRGKAKSLSADVGKQDTTLDSQGEDSPREIVSRSGRKIKPKRFADFAGSEEPDNLDKSENAGKNRGKNKAEDSGEGQVPSTAAFKKKLGSEKKHSIDEISTLEDSVMSSGGPSTDPPNRFLLARTFAGEYVGIKLDIDRPKTFESEKARMQWDWSTAKNAMKLKSQLESGEILPEQVKESLDFNVHFPEDEKRLLSKDGAMERKKYKLRWLRTEAQLLQLDTQIKSNLGLDRANTEKCLQAMDEMLSLSIGPLMLKKHPHIVETVKRLRRYIGNLADWKLSEEEVVNFKQKAEQIRQKAEHIYNKFKAMFTIPDGQSFWQSFTDQVVHFKELTKDMSEEKVFSLISDPTCSDTAVSEDSLTDENINQSDIGGGDTEAEEVPARCETPKELSAK